MGQDLAQSIVNKATELGYESCGVIKNEDMAGFAQRYAERLEKEPNYYDRGDQFERFAYPDQVVPWAKSLVICAWNYGQYHVPQHLQGRVGKVYLLDERRNEETDMFKASAKLERFMLDNGLQVACNRHFPKTSVRWAAQQAGLGIFRKNNFVYGPNGSWILFEVFFIDQELEHKQSNALKPCPDNCRLCVEACPTGALSAPYVMNRGTCVAELTTWGGRDLPNEPCSSQMGEWLYGCDVCQDVCPQNRGKWRSEKTFPGLDALAQVLSPESILQMDYEELARTVAPKLWYFKEDELWKFKVNALNALKNSYTPSHRPCIEQALADPCVQVRDMAQWVLDSTA